MWDVWPIRKACSKLEFEETFDKIRKLDYELNNSNFGNTFTGAKNHEELGKYITALGERLAEIGNVIADNHEELDKKVGI